MAKEAVTKALEDAGVPYDAIEAAVRLLRGSLQYITFRLTVVHYLCLQ